MKREKKISVYHFLNKRVAGKVNPETGKLEYPIYVRVRYKRKQTEFTTRYFLFDPDMDLSLKGNYNYFLRFGTNYTEEGFEEAIKAPIFKLEVQYIKQLVEYIDKKYSKNFISDLDSVFILDLFLQPFKNILDLHLRNQVREWYRKTYGSKKDIINWNIPAIFLIHGLIELKLYSPGVNNSIDRSYELVIDCENYNNRNQVQLVFFDFLLNENIIEDFIALLSPQKAVQTKEIIEENMFLIEEKGNLLS